MNTISKHPKEVLDKVNFIEKKHKTMLKKFLKEKKQYQPAYIYDEVLRGIILKRTNIVNFHPGDDSFLSNIYYKISHDYYEIIRKYNGNHIAHLEKSLELNKASLIVAMEKHNKVHTSAELNFINQFKIGQAINFIARDLAYQNMREDDFFNLKMPENPHNEFRHTDEIGSNTHLQLPKTSTSKPDNDDILTAAGAAQLTGLSINTIRQKTSKKTIPHHKLPNSSAVRYSKRELLSWIESSQTLNTKSLLDGIQRNIKKKK